MKKVRFMLLLATVGLFASNSQAQGFGGSGSKYLQLGLGISNHYSVYSDYDRMYNNNFAGFSLQMEFGIHKYIGLGFLVGAEAGIGDVGYHGPYIFGNPDAYWSFGIPVGMNCNFHFLQLIADKAGKSFADKMDVYAGMNIGSGPVFRNVREKFKNEVYYDNRVGALFFIGPHAGIRYFPKDKIGIYGEIGFGKAFTTGGVIFKL
nr:hypothetical protein [uncultured Fluviicola sp.]